MLPYGDNETPGRINATIGCIIRMVVSQDRSLSPFVLEKKHASVVGSLLRVDQFLDVGDATERFCRPMGPLSAIPRLPACLYPVSTCVQCTAPSFEVSSSAAYSDAFQLTFSPVDQLIN